MSIQRRWMMLIACTLIFENQTDLIKTDDGGYGGS